jgi:hypothetical protein
MYLKYSPYNKQAKNITDLEAKRGQKFLFTRVQGSVSINISSTQNHQDSKQKLVTSFLLILMG